VEDVTFRKPTRQIASSILSPPVAAACGRKGLSSAHNFSRGVGMLKLNQPGLW
jgi:hypothetical protein